MAKRSAPIILLALVLQACAASPARTSPPSGPTSSVEARSSAAPTPPRAAQTLAEATRTVAPSPARPSLTPTIEVIEPQATRLCPVRPEVPLEQLDLGPRFRVLLRRAHDPQDWGAFIVSDMDPPHGQYQTPEPTMGGSCLDLPPPRADGGSCSTMWTPPVDSDQPR